MSRQALSAARIEVVVGLIESESGEILVNRRREGSHMAGLWEFPGGKRDLGETPFEALRRELTEELSITITRAQPFIELEHDYPDRSVALDVWLVEHFTGTPQPAEAQELRWVSVEALEALELLAADAPIVTALSRRRARGRLSSA